MVLNVAAGTTHSEPNLVEKLNIARGNRGAHESFRSVNALNCGLASNEAKECSWCVPPRLPMIYPSTIPSPLSALELYNLGQFTHFILSDVDK